MRCVSDPTRTRLIISLAALALLLIQGPLFLAAPLGPDPVMYDLQAQVVNDGGVLYRDSLEPNLPGAVWIHLAVRSIAGWSPLALRSADLLLVLTAALLASTIAIPCRSQESAAQRAATRGLVILLLLGGYVTLSEWCHCQRDVWTLPFVLGAIAIRIRRIDGSSQSSRMLTPMLEGVLWGAAVWLKPHVALVGASVICVSAFAEWRWRRTCAGCFREFVWTISGGMLIGTMGSVWLIQHGAWTYLWTTLTEWNPEYLASSANRWSWGRLWSIQDRLLPWSLIHLAAIPIAARTLWRLAKTTREEVEECLPAAQVVLSAAYLAWVGQTLLLQHLFDYVHVPAIVLGATLVATSCARMHFWATSTMPRLALAASAMVAVSVGSSASRLPAWPLVVLKGDTTASRAALAQLPVPDWRALDDVRNFLVSQRIHDGELTAYHTHTIHLYPMLGIRPSTRYAFTETHLRLFPSRSSLIQKALDASNQRFVLSSLLEAGLDSGQIAASNSVESWRDRCPPESLDRFPFNQPVVFRSGPYLVHRVVGRTGGVETRFFPLARQ